jgi:hypothetical protein
MFTLKITRHFSFEIANGGVYLKAGKREMFYSRAQGFTFD